MATAPPTTALTSRVDYEPLKNWIARQEAYEAANNRPAPLSDAQRKAVEDFPLDDAPPVEEPYVGDTDWISQLMMYRDSQLGVTIRFTENGVLGNNGQSRWLCSVRLQHGSSLPVEFPKPIEPSDGTTPYEPSFVRKKKAKQYAAKCCVEHLMSSGKMPPDGGQQAVLSKPSKAQLTQQPTAKDDTPRSSSLLAAQAAAVAVHDDDEIAATRRVPELCRELGFQAPRYELAALEGKDIWEGRPRFGVDAPHIPENIGVVHGIYGKKWAKEKMAEEVANYLQQELARRRAQAASMLEGSGQETQGEDEAEDGQ